MIVKRRRTFAFTRQCCSPAVFWRVLGASLLLAILAWAIAALRFLTGNDGANAAHRLRDTDRRVASPERHGVPAPAVDPVVMVALDVETSARTVLTVRIVVAAVECPKAHEFLAWMIANQDAECRPCTVYRGEPVPSYWGSPAYPDRWDHGGRWGPPYALVQGGFPNRRVSHVEREAHRPEVERGMVAWAGPRGTHFFVALARHPEWGHEHTVWGRVVEEDMAALDALVDGSRPLAVRRDGVPVVTDFVDPMPFRIRNYP